MNNEDIEARLKDYELRTLLSNWDMEKGEVRIFPSSRTRYYVWFYNGGFSDNEVLEESISHLEENVVVKAHPTLVLKISTSMDSWFSQILKAYSHLVQEGYVDMEIHFIDAQDD